jgi:hypothetical protein
MVETSARSQKSGAHRGILLTTAAASSGVGIFGIGFGGLWAPKALKFAAGNEIASVFEFAIPFAPISLIALGAYLAVRSRL